MNNCDVVVYTSDKHLWCLPSFAYLFNKYWGDHQRVFVAGYSIPRFRLPPNFMFYSIADHEYPKDKWVDGLIEFFTDFYHKDQAVLLLEDYWLARRVDTLGIDDLVELCASRPDILRVDLTADRLYAGGMKDAFYYRRFDIVEAPMSQYQLSMQAGIWNRANLLKLMHMLPKDRHDPWDMELEGTTVVNANYDQFRVFGTRQNLIRYANGANNAKGPKAIYDLLTPEDQNAIKTLIPMEYQ